MGLLVTSGVITYATNHNTDEVVRRLATSTPSDPTRSPLRILLETDAPYMAPANLTRVQQQSLNQKSNARYVQYMLHSFEQN